MNYMGSVGLDAAREQRRERGHPAGEGVATLPDSESDIIVVSGEYARKRGFEVDRGGTGS